MREKIAHDVDVNNPRNIGEPGRAIAQQGGSHQFEHRVFGPGNHDATLKWVTGSNLDACTGQVRVPEVAGHGHQYAPAVPVRQRTLTRTLRVGEPRATEALAPRDDIVAEAPPETTPDGTVVFVQAEGPFERWERRVTITGDSVQQTIVYAMDVPWFSWLYRWPVARTVAHRPASGTMPWWAPPDRLDTRTVRILGLLAAAAMASAFMNTLFTQTVAFAADDFGVGNTGVGVAGSLVRVGIIITVPLAVAGDRIGRLRAVLVAAWAAPVVTALGALAPNFGVLVATQSVGRP